MNDSSPAEPGSPPDRPAGERDGPPVPGDGSGGPPQPEPALDEEGPDGETWVPV